MGRCELSLAAFFCLTLWQGAMPALAAETVSEFKFENESESQIWVNQVGGFPSNPRCGVLGPGNSAELFLGPEEIPETVTIEWWKGNRTERDSEAVSAELSLADIPAEDRTDKIVFVFEANETWSVHFE